MSHEAPASSRSPVRGRARERDAVRVRQCPRARRHAPGRQERPPGSALIAVAAWLLALIGAGALYVSFSAQYAYVFHVRHQDAASVIEALLLDLLMIVFTLLALGLARAGKSAAPSGR